MADSRDEPNADTPDEPTAAPIADADPELGGQENDAAVAAEATDDDSLAAENAKLKDQLLRALAELENVRKRAEREKEQTRKFGIADFARDLLSVSDNLRRALDAAPQDRTQIDEALGNLITGVEMTEKELLSAFEKHGIRKLQPLGEVFDYNFHQAMFEVESNDHGAGIVMQVLQVGYAIGDRLLRPAMVGVSKGSGGAGENIDTSA
jgi:molecular chaperone GrpE|tara:strand:+ start:558 stop:1181 length:624 start_codon:yes stop_codon:yes gene_type:complete